MSLRLMFSSMFTSFLISAVAPLLPLVALGLDAKYVPSPVTKAVTPIAVNVMNTIVALEFTNCCDYISICYGYLYKFKIELNCCIYKKNIGLKRIIKKIKIYMEFAKKNNDLVLDFENLNINFTLHCILLM